MFNKLKSLLLEGGLKPEPKDRRFAEREIAAAALLIEVAQSDGEYDAKEHTQILDLLARKFALDAAEAASLMDIAGRRQIETAQLYSFTRRINDTLNAEEKIALVEMVWDVVYADGRLDTFEDSLVRRIAGLIHVSDRDRAEARQRVLARRGGN